MMGLKFSNHINLGEEELVKMCQKCQTPASPIPLYKRSKSRSQVITSAWLQTGNLGLQGITGAAKMTLVKLKLRTFIIRGIFIT